MKKVEVRCPEGELLFGWIRAEGHLLAWISQSPEAIYGQVLRFPVADARKLGAYIELRVSMYQPSGIGQQPHLTFVADVASTEILRCVHNFEENEHWGWVASICTECAIHHVQNCRECAGFGLRKSHDGVRYITAGEAHGGSATDWVECRMCGGTPAGFQRKPQ